MPFFYLAQDKIRDWVTMLADEYAVYLPAVIEGKVHFCRFDNRVTEDKQPSPALDRIRAVEPLKAFLFSARETVASFPDRDRVPDKRRRQLVIGAKNCDLMPLKIHQKMFLERDFVDPFYKQRLASTVIISADCPSPEDTCFCNLLGLTPYPDSGGDVNLSALDSGYLLEPLSAVGRELVSSGNRLFRPASEAEIEMRERLRQEASARLRQTNPQPWRKDLSDAIDRSKDEKFWREAARDCVECYACLIACPTCFCYLMYDQAVPAKGGGESGSSFDRVRVWDACYYQGYARVGGGGNPRPKMWERFRNRFHCKWMNCTRDLGFHSCSGCGRCFSACMGKIDIRRILGAV